MARLTDRIKDRISKDPYQKLKQAQEAPAWLSGAGIWVGLAAVALAGILLLYVGFTNDGPDQTTTASQGEENGPQQEINPHEVEGEDSPSDEGGSSSEPSTGSSPSEGGEEAEDTDYSHGDFTALDSVSMPVETSSLDSSVPAGAVNVAKAGAEATASGDWTDIPTNQSPDDDRYLGAKVNFDSLRLTDPVGADADADKAFTFLVDAVDKDGTEVQFTVTAKWSGDSYQVINF